jgi:hypothetical protein
MRAYISERRVSRVVESRAGSVREPVISMADRISIVLGTSKQLLTMSIFMIKLDFSRSFIVIGVSSLFKYWATIGKASADRVSNNNNNSIFADDILVYFIFIICADSFKL